MTRTLKTLTLVMSLSAPAAVLAQDAEKAPAADTAPAAEAPAIPAEAKDAEVVLIQYLDAVKAKKWAQAKKLIHPKTMGNIAQRKKNLGHEDHPMAAWFYEKSQYWMKDYKVTGAKPAYDGTWIFTTSEDNFQVEEKGISEGDEAHYLVGRTSGKWMVVDKKRGVNFSKDSIKYGYKNWFDASEKKTAEAVE